MPRCDKLVTQIKEIFVLEVMHEPLQSVMTVKSELLKQLGKLSESIDFFTDSVKPELEFAIKEMAHV